MSEVYSEQWCCNGIQMTKGWLFCPWCGLELGDWEVEVTE